MDFENIPKDGLVMDCMCMSDVINVWLIESNVFLT